MKIVKHFIYCELPKPDVLFCSVISSLTPLFLLFFFKLQNRELIEDSKNLLKTVIFSLQVVFTRDFVPDSLQTVFLAVQTLTPLFSLTVPNFVVFF